MEAIALFFTKFADEILAAQLAVLFVALSLGLYWMLIRKKKRETQDWVPAALVRQYLDRVKNDERDIRFKLFGEASSAANTGTVMAGGTQVVTVADPNMARELEALRAQLLAADQRSLDFDKLMTALKAEKAALEEKLKAAMAGGGGAAAGVDTAALAAIQKQLDDAKAKLQEYEVIEDDLANLKKFQKENEQLKQKIEAMEKGGDATKVISGTPAAPETTTVISGTTQKIETPVTVVSGGTAEAAKPADAPAAGKPKEDELLSEFEKMLAS